MITLKLNEKTITAQATDSLWEVLQKQGFSSGCYAVALNSDFVPRHRYSETMLNNHDQIDIIQPMQGG